MFVARLRHDPLRDFLLEQYCHCFEMGALFEYFSNNGCGDVVGKIADEMHSSLWEELFQRDCQDITLNYLKFFSVGVRVVLSENLDKPGIDFNGNHTPGHAQKLLGELSSSWSYLQDQILAGQICETDNFLTVVITEEMLSPIFEGRNFFKQ